MNLDQVLEALAGGAEIRAMYENTGVDGTYYLVTVHAPVPGILLADLCARGLVDPEEHSQQRYKLRTDPP